MVNPQTAFSQNCGRFCALHRGQFSRTMQFQLSAGDSAHYAGTFSPAPCNFDYLREILRITQGPFLPHHAVSTICGRFCALHRGQFSRMMQFQPPAGDSACCTEVVSPAPCSFNRLREISHIIIPCFQQPHGTPLKQPADACQQCLRRQIASKAP